MGFLDWFKAQPSSDDYELEERKVGPITGYSSNQELTSDKSVDRRLTDACKEKGASPFTNMKVDRVLHEEVLGHNRAELKEGLGMDRNGPAGSKAFPVEAQEAMIVGKVYATHDIKQADIKSEDQDDIDNEVVDVARESGKETRKRFPW